MSGFSKVCKYNLNFSFMHHWISRNIEYNLQKEQRNSQFNNSLIHNVCESDLFFSSNLIRQLLFFQLIFHVQAIKKSKQFPARVLELQCWNSLGSLNVLKHFSSRYISIFFFYQNTHISNVQFWYIHSTIATKYLSIQKYSTRFDMKL